MMNLYLFYQEQEYILIYYNSIRTQGREICLFLFSMKGGESMAAFNTVKTLLQACVAAYGIWMIVKSSFKRYN